MRRSVLALAGAVLVGGSVLAHHGYSEFYMDRSASIEGELLQLSFANPHVVLQVRTTDGSIYTAMWGPPYQLERDGVTRKTLSVGDRVIVAGAPPRDPSSRHLMPVWEVRRPRDGWGWKHNRGPLRPQD